MEKYKIIDFYKNMICDSLKKEIILQCCSVVIVKKICFMREYYFFFNKYVFKFLLVIIK